MVIPLKIGQKDVQAARMGKRAAGTQPRSTRPRASTRSGAADHGRGSRCGAVAINPPARGTGDVDDVEEWVAITAAINPPATTDVDDVVECNGAPIDFNQPPSQARRPENAHGVPCGGSTCQADCGFQSENPRGGLRKRIAEFWSEGTFGVLSAEVRRGRFHLWIRAPLGSPQQLHKPPT